MNKQAVNVCKLNRLQTLTVLVTSVSPRITLKINATTLIYPNSPALSLQIHFFTVNLHKTDSV